MVQQIKKVQMGKNGLTPEFLSQVKSIFINERMLKVSVLKSACRDKDELKIIATNMIDELGKKYDFKIIGYVITLIKFRKDVRK